MNKITSYALLLIVASMMFAIPLQTYAEADLNTLVTIATQARSHIKSELSSLTNVPQEITDLYRQGSIDTDSLIQAAQQDDIETSKQHFMSAMKKFEEISRLIQQHRPGASDALDESTSNSDLNHVLERVIAYVTKLKQVAETHNVDTNFDSLDELIQTTQEQINNGQSDDALKSIEILKKQVLVVYGTLKNVAEQEKQERAKDFAERHVEQLNVLIVNANELGISNDTISKLEQSRIALKDTSNSTQIVKHVKIVLQIKEKFDETKIDRINARIQHLEEKLDKISNTNNNEQITKAKESLRNINQLIQDGNYDGVISLITRLNNLISDIETSQNTQSVTNDLSDADRMLDKIQELDNTLNEFAGQIDENTAANRWLERALSLIDIAKSQVNDSPEDAIKTILDIVEIIDRIQKITN